MSNENVYVFVGIILEPAVDSRSNRHGGVILAQLAAITRREALLWLNCLRLPMIGDRDRIRRISVQQIDGVKGGRAARATAVVGRRENRHDTPFGVPGEAGPITQSTLT